MSGVTVVHQSNGFNDFAREFMPMWLEKQREQRLIDSYKAMAGVDNPSIDTTSMQPTQVPVATSPIPGQSGITTQPSEAVQSPTVQTETQMLPQEDLYKKGKADILNAYSQKIKTALPQMRDSRVAAQFIHQAMTDRDMALAQHNSDSFQQDLMSLSADTEKSPTQKAAIAFSLNSKYKIGMKPQEILQMFEGPKPVALSDGGVLVNPITGKIVAQAPRKEMSDYEKARLAQGNKQTGQLTEYQKYQIEKDKQNSPSEKMVDTPLGKITVSKFIDLHRDALGGETLTEKQDPITGDMVKGKTIKPPKPEILKWTQPIYNKINGVQDKPAGNVDTNNLSPAQMEVAKNLKNAGYSKEEVIAELNKTGE